MITLDSTVNSDNKVLFAINYANAGDREALVTIPLPWPHLHHTQMLDKTNSAVPTWQLHFVHSACEAKMEIHT